MAPPVVKTSTVLRTPPSTMSPAVTLPLVPSANVKVTFAKVLHILRTRADMAALLFGERGDKVAHVAHDIYDAAVSRLRPFEIEKRRKRMAALPDERPAAVRAPERGVRRVRTAVGFLAAQKQHLVSRRLNQAAALLH